MAKLSWMKWYPADWINDTRELSAEAKGCWMDMICLMWNSPRRGRWSGTYQEFARATGIPWEIAPRIIAELGKKTACVTICNADVTLISRRIVKLEKHYKLASERVRRHRRNANCNAHVTAKTLDSSRLLKTQDSKNTSKTTPSACAAPFWKELIGHVNDTWMRRKGGSKYPWTAKDAALLKRLSGIYQPWGVMALWDAYLRSGDSWAADHGYDVPTFSTQIPKLVDDPRWKMAAQSYNDKLMPPNPEGVKQVKELVASLGKGMPQ